jgi:hypothetical protein
MLKFEQSRLRKISTYLPFGLLGLSGGSSLGGCLLLSSDTSVLELGTMSLLSSDGCGGQTNAIQLALSLDTGAKVENGGVTTTYNSTRTRGRLVIRVLHVEK